MLMPTVQKKEKLKMQESEYLRIKYGIAGLTWTDVEVITVFELDGVVSCDFLKQMV